MTQRKKARGRFRGRHFPARIGDSKGKGFELKGGQTVSRPKCRDCEVCKLQGRATASGLPIRTAFCCPDCFAHGKEVALCPDTCFRVWHTERLAKGDEMTRRKRKRKPQESQSESSEDDSDDSATSV